MYFLIAAAGAAALAAPAAQSPSGRLSPKGPAIELSTGLEYREGDYGTGGSVETVTIPTALRLAIRQLQLSAEVSYVRVDSPGNVVAGGLLGLPPIIDPTRPPARERREGIGDLKLSAAYTLPTQSVGLTVSGQVKLPTASAARGLGTGGADYALAAELFRSFGRVTPFVGLGYTMPGDPDGYSVRNSLSARAGAAVQMSDRVRGHVSYGYAQSVSPLIADEQQVASGIDAGVSDRLSLGIYGAAGLSQGSPDIGAGIRLGFRIR